MSVDKLLAILLYKDTVTTVMVENTIYHLVNVQFPWLGSGGNVWEQEGPEGPGSLTWGKVKGHSEANNREPQGHNLNNFGRGPIDDVIYEIWKHWAL